MQMYKMNDDRSHSSLLVPPSTQDWMQGVLSAKVVLVMYGDYQCSRSADVYKMIKAIGRELSACFEIIYALSSVFRKHRFILMLNGSPSRRCRRCPRTVWSMHDTLFAHQQKLENGYRVRQRFRA